MRRRHLLALFVMAAASPLWADKVIMKDGKIYEGHIMGESSHSLLILNPPLDPKPRFIELRDVMTIVRESRPPERPAPPETRFPSVTLGVTGQAFGPNPFGFSPAAGLYAGGAFRIHPAVELGGELQWIPTLAGGGLTISDGQTIRGYESFYAYDGGFSGKVFPFFKRSDWRAEPYLLAGYHWNRLIPKGSGDTLKGASYFGGIGVMLPWWKPLYWDFRCTYAHTSYDRIKFLSGEGDLSGVSTGAFSMSIGLSYRYQ